MQLFHLQDLALGIGRNRQLIGGAKAWGHRKMNSSKHLGKLITTLHFFLQRVCPKQWQVLPAISNQVSCTTVQFLDMIESHFGGIFFLNHHLFRTLFPTNLGMGWGRYEICHQKPPATSRSQKIMVNIANMDPLGLIFSGTLLVSGRGYTVNLINTMPHPYTIGWCEKNDLWDIIRVGWKKHNSSKSKPWKSWRDLNTSLPTRPTNIYHFSPKKNTW